ncbi:MAG: hypothetical protein C0500_04330 [Sphingobium sp.]|nr:hypothetical protein [Sphingobium sp.]
MSTILPPRGRWRPQADGGGVPQANRSGPAPSTAFGGPPPASGEDFADRAAKLAGLAGALFGWSPDTFWNATPAEFASVVAALVGDAAPPPPDPATIAQLMEVFPDG